MPAPKTKIPKSEVIKELIRCGRDPIYFITTYGKIQHPVKGLLPFKLYPFQEDIVRGYVSHRKNIILKARQLGVTTVTAAYIAWLLLFHRDKNVLIVATKQETSKNMIRIVRNIYKYIPKWMLDVGKIDVDNRHSVELKNGSRVKAVTTSTDVGRSEAISMLVVDEVAHIKNFDEIWTGLSPVVSTGGCIALMSTPKGTGNAFHKLYVGAKNDENGFNCRFGTYINPYDPTIVYNDKLMWWVHPEHDEVWFAAESKDKSHRDINQEFLCFAANTRIATDKGYRNIQDLRVGDSVLTHKGRFKKIVATNNRIANDVFSTKTYSNRVVTKLTSEHPLLSDIDGWQAFEKLSEKNSVCAHPKNIDISPVPRTVDLYKLLQPGCFKISLSEDEKKVYINDRRFKTQINRHIELDYDMGLFLGLYLAEGHKGKNYISFSFNKDTELNTWVVKLCDILKEKFGFEVPKIYNSSSKASILQANSQILSQFVSVLTEGASCYDKKISAFTYEHGSRLFYRGIVDGLYLGDGCTKFEYNKCFTTVSENLAYDLKYLLMLDGFENFSFRKLIQPRCGVILGRTVSFADKYEVKLLCTRMKSCDVVSDLRTNRDVAKTYSHKNLLKENENFAITSLLDKSRDATSEVVYNIEIEDDHSYVTEHFVAHNCEFNASGDTFIYYEDLTKLETQVREPIRHFQTDRNLWIWEEPQPGGVYLVPVDVSRGDAKDYSAFHVLRLDVTPIRQVAEYKAKIKPDQLGILLVSAAQFYNNATIAPENNSGWSGQTILKIQESQYPFMHYSPRRKPKEKDSLVVDPYYAASRNDYLPGYAVTSANRLPMLAKLEQYIRMDDVEINSSRLLEELKTFIVTEHNRPEAQRGYHDDLIMSLAGGLYVREEAGFLYAHRGDELTKAMLNGLSTSQTRTSQYSDFNFNAAGFYDRGRIVEHMENQNKIRMANGDVLDLNWLISKG